MPQPLFLDRPASAALLAGSLLISISLFTNYGHGALSTFSNSRWMSRSEYVSTLPLWRSCLTMWHRRIVYMIEITQRRFALLINARQ
jgi:capsular polysaccharide biosynthesis protein